MIEKITLFFWDLIEGHSNMSTCAVEIRQLGFNRFRFKLSKVISGMSQKVLSKCPLCCLFTACFNCSHSFNRPKQSEKYNSSSVTTCRGELAKAQLGSANGQGIRTL